MLWPVVTCDGMLSRVTACYHMLWPVVAWHGVLSRVMACCRVSWRVITCRCRGTRLLELPYVVKGMDVSFSGLLSHVEVSAAPLRAVGTPIGPPDPIGSHKGPQ